jgi:hypothetical protein
MGEFHPDAHTKGSFGRRTTALISRRVFASLRENAVSMIASVGGGRCIASVFIAVITYIYSLVIYGGKKKEERRKKKDRSRSKDKDKGKNKNKSDS